MLETPHPPTPAAAEILASEFWLAKVNRGLAESHSGNTQSIEDYLASSEDDS